MVAKEVAGSITSLTESQIEYALRGVLSLLNSRASEAIAEDPRSDESHELAAQYLALSETLLYLGTQLIAFEDMESADIPEVSIVEDDERFRN